MLLDYNYLNSEANLILEPFQYPIIQAALKLFLVIYAGILAPKLPQSVLQVTELPAVKISILFLIGWASSYDPGMAILIAVGLFVTLNLIAGKKPFETFATPESHPPISLFAQILVVHDLLQNKLLGLNSHDPDYNTKKQSLQMQVNGYVIQLNQYKNFVSALSAKNLSLAKQTLVNQRVPLHTQLVQLMTSGQITSNQYQTILKQVQSIDTQLSNLVDTT